MDWQDAFEGVIPAERLMDAFRAALSVHKGSFPVNAFEVLEAWKGIAPPALSDWEWQRFITENNRPKWK